MNSDMNEAMGIVNYDLPIAYADGSPAKFLGISDGRYAVTPRGMPDHESGNYYDKYGNHIYGHYAAVRNVAQPTSAPEVPAALVERMVALVRDLSLPLSRRINTGDERYAEARAIVAELTPVDGDEREAKKIVQKWYDDDSYDAAYDAILAAIRRGRELERGEGL